MIRLRPMWLVAMTIVSTACSSMGPKSVTRDSFEYNDALSTTWKRQMLLNMVKLRYGDTPVFLEVASVINQYSVEGTLGFSSPGWDRPNNVGPPIVGAGGRWADRPTITYLPMSGEKFTRSLLSPIPPVSLLAMAQSGWPVEFVFGIAVRAINGVANGTRSVLLRQEPDPQFGELLRALDQVQRSSRIGMRIDRRPEGDVAVMVLSQGELGPVERAREAIREILGLGIDATEFRLLYGSVAAAPDEVAMLTRSMLEVIGEFSFGIDVPPEHEKEGRAQAAPAFEGPWAPPTVHIHSGSQSPADAFVRINYRDTWFWIDDRDYASKRMFSFLLMLTSLAESGSSPAAPLVTVGVGG